MGTTEIGSINELKNQGGNVIDSSEDFGTTIKKIFELYDNLKENWQGTKSNEYKEKIDKLHDPLLTIVNAVETQGEAISELARDIKNFEERM